MVCNQQSILSKSHIDVFQAPVKGHELALIVLYIYQKWTTRHWPCEKNDLVYYIQTILWSN